MIPERLLVVDTYMTVQAQEDKGKKGPVVESWAGWREAPHFLKESKLCCREITRLGADLNVGLISVKFYLQDLRQTLLLCGLRNIRNGESF